MNIDDGIFDWTCHIEHTPIGYAVFCDDLDGQQVSPAFDERKSAEIWLAGWQDARDKVDAMSS